MNTNDELDWNLIPLTMSQPKRYVIRLPSMMLRNGYTMPSETLHVMAKDKKEAIKHAKREWRKNLTERLKGIVADDY